MDTFYKAWEYVTNICEPVMLWLLLKSNLPQKRSKRILSVVGVIILAGITTLMNMAEWPYVPVVLIGLVAFCTYSLLFFEGTAHIRIFWAALMIFIIVFGNAITAEIPTLLPAVTVEAIQYPSLERFIIQLSYIVLLLILTGGLILWGKRVRDISFSTAVWMVALCVLCSAALYLMIDVTFTVFSAGNSTVLCLIVTLLIFILTVSALLLISAVNKREKLYMEAKTEADALRREASYNDELMQVFSSVRQIKHDYASHISTIAGLYHRGKTEELDQYLESYAKEYGDVDYYAVTGDVSIDSLLSSKLMVCKANDIKVELSAFGWGKTSLTSAEMVSLLGNLIDNAVNACNSVDPENRAISITFRRKASMLNISVTNSTNGTVPEKALSGGLGLPRIRSIVDKCDGLFRLRPEDGTMVAEVLLPITEESI
jgi:hypothetical protein